MRRGKTGPEVKPVRLFGLGHSHLTAILAGTKLLGVDDKISVDSIALGDGDFRNLPKCAVDSAAAREVVSRAKAADLVFLSIYGNAHSVLGLVEPPVPVDFHHPVLQLPIVKGAAVVPLHIIRQIFEDTMYGVKAHFAYLRELLDRPLVQCQPPPPKSSESHVRSRPGAFRERLKELRVAAPSLRLKMWQVQSDVLQEMCKETGVAFLPCPQTALDAAGFLAEKMWARDATHANPEYGSLVLRQLAAIARSQSHAPAATIQPRFA